jgi:hypothetical protein
MKHIKLFEGFVEDTVDGLEFGEKVAELCRTHAKDTKPEDMKLVLQSIAENLPTEE